MRFAKLRPLLASLVALGLSVGCGGDDQPAVKKLDTPAAPVAVVEPALPAPQVAAAPTKSDAGNAAAPIAAAEPEGKPEGKIDEAPPVALPPTFEERMDMGKRFLRKAQTDLAIVAFEGASALQPASEKPHVEIARALIAAGDLKAARQHADQAVALAPGSSAAWNTKGRIAFAEKNGQVAIHAFEKATETNTDNAYAWNNLGLAYMAVEKWDDAIAALETATGLPRPQPYMYTNLGVAYEKAGRLTEARTAYKDGTSHGSSESRQALLRLDDLKAQAGPSVDE